MLDEKIIVKDLPLCRVLFEDNVHYPWVMLVPRRSGVFRIMDLSHEDQFQLLKELDLVQKIMWEEFQPTQLNVAAIGNKTPQLHIHVIARFEHDPAWPGTVWDHSSKERCDKKTRDVRLKRIFQRLNRQHKEWGKLDLNQ